MEQLDPPLKRYLSGARPSHSSLGKLHANFTGMEAATLKAILSAGDYLTEQGKASPKAREENLVDSCEGKILWNIEKVMEAASLGGLTLERQAVNQTLPKFTDGEVRWANLGTIGTYFSVSANQIGKWLDDLELRDGEGNPTETSIKSGWVQMVEMNAGGNKTRKVAQWNLDLTCEKLMEAGHELDFNYEETLKGKGRNSDVQVSGVDAKVRELYEKWRVLYKKADTHDSSWRVFDGQPRMILLKVENEYFKKPGLLTQGKYKNLR